MTQEGFPHSEIFGSKVVRHLPETYRRQTASFITSSSQGIHRTPLNFLLGNLKTTFTFFPNSSALYSRDRLGSRHSKCRDCFYPSTHIKTPEFLLIKETQKLVCDGIQLSKFRPEIKAPPLGRAAGLCPLGNLGGYLSRFLCAKFLNIWIRLFYT